MINLKAPTGTRLAVTENEVAKVEDLVRQVVSPEDLGMIVSNIGATPDFSAIYTSNSGQHTAFVQVSLKEDHKIGSYEYMARVKQRIADGAAGAERLLPVRRPGGRRAESGPAGAHRRAGGRLEPGAGVRHRARSWPPQIREIPRRGRRLHPAGHRLSGAAARRRPHARRANWAWTSRRWSTTSSPR